MSAYLSNIKVLAAVIDVLSTERNVSLISALMHIPDYVRCGVYVHTLSYRVRFICV
jgi:hypothetical protein